MATKKTTEEETVNTSETPKKTSTRKTTKKTTTTESTEPEKVEKPKRNYSWKSSVKKPTKKADNDIDLHDLVYQQGRRFSQDTDQRKFLSGFIFFFIAGFIVCVLAAIFLLGFGLMKINDNVVITLLTTTTIQVIGLGVIVTKGLFGNNSPEVS